MTDDMIHDHDPEGDRFLRTADVLKEIACGRTKFWTIRKRGDFPEPVMLDQKTRRWRLSDVRRWQNSHPKGAAVLREEDQNFPPKSKKNH